MTKSKVNTMVNDEDQLTEEQKGWWNELKSLRIDIYGFSDQELCKFAQPINIDSDSLFLMVKAPAVSPALEVSLRTVVTEDPVSKVRYPKFSMKTEDKYAVIFPTKGKILKDAGGKFFFKPQV